MARAVGEFAIASLVAVLLIGFAAVHVLQAEGSGEAVSDATDLTRLAARGIAQPLVSDALVAGDRTALGRLDRLLRSSVLGTGITRVRIWTAEGRIIYSDGPLPVGSIGRLSARELGSLRSGTVFAEESTDPGAPENGARSSTGRVLNIYVPIHTTGGRPVLFEASLPSHEISASAHHLWVAFAPALLGGLALMALIQLPLAWSLATRLRRGQQERERLLARAIEASERERRRIARDLHDGVVQDLAGVAFALAASAEGEGVAPALAKSLRLTASQTRQSMRALRTLLVDIYPPTLRSAGLEAALSDLVSGVAGQGIDARLEFATGPGLSEPVEALFYRVAQEALRNVVAHARADHVEVSVVVAGMRAILTIQDDGAGFTPEAALQRAGAGHVGLGLLADLVREHGGRLEVTSEPGQGTRIRAEVDRP